MTQAHSQVRHYGIINSIYEYMEVSTMNEMILKYGCNPNQKPSKVFMENGSDLPIEVLCVKAAETGCFAPKTSLFRYR